MKIGIITICTGNYTIFFKELYESFEQYFLKDYEKTYYVFTDGDIGEYKNLVKIDQKKLGWPHDTMMRFHMFNQISSQLIENDFIFFVNANMVAVKEIGEEILPGMENDFLMGVQHPGYRHNNPLNFPYDRNINCSCYVPHREGEIYFQGCFNGGRANSFLDMSLILAANIDRDIQNNIIPLWHDESQLNWYYKDKNPLMVSSSYAYPESWNLPIEKIMIQVDKQKHGGHGFLRGELK